MNDKTNMQDELDSNNEGANDKASNITPDDHNDETSSKYDGDTVPKEMTRSTLALTFVIGFFCGHFIMFYIFMLSWIFCWRSERFIINSIWNPFWFTGLCVRVLF